MVSEYNFATFSSTLKYDFFTSIFLFLTAFIKHVSKGAKNANSKLFSKSDRADSRVGNI